MRAFTIEGSVDSDIATIILGDVPEAPSTEPVLDVALSTATKLIVNYPALGSTETGGLPILSYSIEMDDGQGGAFIPLRGVLTNSLTTSITVMSSSSLPIIKGRTYRF